MMSCLRFTGRREMVARRPWQIQGAIGTSAPHLIRAAAGSFRNSKLPV